MLRIPVEQFKTPKYDDQDVILAWKWFMSFIHEGDWQKRKETIENKISFGFSSVKPISKPLTEGTLIVVKDDVIDWYLYLVDMLINEPHKYEYFQGARIVPIFKRFGSELELLKSIGGVEKKVKDMLKKRKSEADALLFEMLTALLWARNGFEVEFLEESKTGRTPDLIAKKADKTWFIECKRQSKTSDYTYRETAKRQKMISYLNKILIDNNVLLDIVFHVELETLPDTFLKDLLEHKIKLAITGRIVSNTEVDIDLAFVDIPSIKRSLENHYVKYPSPRLNQLIGTKPVDNKGFTTGLLADFFRFGEGEVNNLYVNDITNAYGVFWRCDAKEALQSKARDIKSKLYDAIQQFNSDSQGVVHIGMETFDGPEVEMERVKKITDTIENIDSAKTNLRWIYCHFFQSYSPPDQNWVFDETVNSITSDQIPNSPLSTRLLIVPEEGESIDNVSHWDRKPPIE